jgi:hypothetical protein
VGPNSFSELAEELHLNRSGERGAMILITDAILLTPGIPGAKGIPFATSP